MNDESAFYKTKSTQMDGFVVQEITIDKLYNGLKAIAEAEEISIEEVIIMLHYGKSQVVLTIRIILNRTLRY